MNNEMDNRLAKYKQAKLKVLKQMTIKLTPEQKSKLLSAQTENLCDAYARDIIKDFFDEMDAKEERLALLTK